MNVTQLKRALNARDPEPAVELVSEISEARAEWALEGAAIERGPLTYRRLRGKSENVVHCHDGLDVDTVELGPAMATRRRRDRAVRTNRAWHLIADADLDVARALRSSVRAPLLNSEVRVSSVDNPVDLALPRLSAFERLEGLVLLAPRPDGVAAALAAKTRWLSLHGFSRLEGELDLPRGLRDLRIGGNVHAYTFAGGEDLEVLHLWPRIGGLPLEQLRKLPKLRALRVIGNGNRGLSRLAGTTIEDLHVGITDSDISWIPDVSHALPKLSALRISGTFTHGIQSAVAAFRNLEELDLRDATAIELRVLDLEYAANSSLQRLRLSHAPNVTVPASAARLFQDSAGAG